MKITNINELTYDEIITHIKQITNNEWLNTWNQQKHQTKHYQKNDKPADQ